MEAPLRMLSPPEYLPAGSPIIGTIGHSSPAEGSAEEGSPSSYPGPNPFRVV